MLVCLTCDYEIQTMTGRMTSYTQTAEMSFLCWIPGLSFRDGAKLSVTQGAVGVEPLLLCIRRSRIGFLVLPYGGFHVPLIGDPEWDSCLGFSQRPVTTAIWSGTDGHIGNFETPSTPNLESITHSTLYISRTPLWWCCYNLHKIGHTEESSLLNVSLWFLNVSLFIQNTFLT